MVSLTQLEAAKCRPAWLLMFVSSVVSHALTGAARFFSHHLLVPLGAAFRQLAADVVPTTPHTWVYCEGYAIGSSCCRELGAADAVKWAQLLRWQHAWGVELGVVCCTLCVLVLVVLRGPLIALGCLQTGRCWRVWRGHACTW